MSLLSLLRSADISWMLALIQRPSLRASLFPGPDGVSVQRGAGLAGGGERVAGAQGRLRRGPPAPGDGGRGAAPRGQGPGEAGLQRRGRWGRRGRCGEGEPTVIWQTRGPGASQVRASQRLDYYIILKMVLADILTRAQFSILWGKDMSMTSPKHSPAPPSLPSTPVKASTSTQRRSDTCSRFGNGLYASTSSDNLWCSGMQSRGPSPSHLLRGTGGLQEPHGHQEGSVRGLHREIGQREDNQLQARAHLPRQRGGVQYPQYREVKFCQLGKQECIINLINLQIISD